MGISAETQIRLTIPSEGKFSYHAWLGGYSGFTSMIVKADNGLQARERYSEYYGGKDLKRVRTLRLRPHEVLDVMIGMVDYCG